MNTLITIYVTLNTICYLLWFREAFDNKNILLKIWGLIYRFVFAFPYVLLLVLTVIYDNNRKSKIGSFLAYIMRPIFTYKNIKKSFEDDKFKRDYISLMRKHNSFYDKMILKLFFRRN